MSWFERLFSNEPEAILLKVGMVLNFQEDNTGAANWYYQLLKNSSAKTPPVLYVKEGWLQIKNDRGQWVNTRAFIERM